MKIIGIFLLCAAAALPITQGYPITEEWMKEFLKTTADRISEHGYPVESHHIETADNYVLTVFRIPYSHNRQNQDERRPAVLVMHGITSSSDGWLLNGPNDALPFLLADAGYDVWLGNARANRYSRNNTRLSPDHPYFWRFSWHEIGIYDMAATVDYMLATTGETRVHYAGHSQGTTVLLVLLAERPEYNAKISTAHLLAPVAFMSHMSNLLAKLTVKHLGQPNKFTRLLDTHEVLPSTMIFVELYETFCKPRPVLDYICQNVYFMIHESEPTPSLNSTVIAHMNETHPAGASTTQLLHYLQEYESGCFCQMDHGEQKNWKTYGQATPPHYAISQITANLHLYYGDNDDLSDPIDVEHLISLLPREPTTYHVPDPLFTHSDFQFSWDVKEIINDRIIAACDAYEAAAASTS